MTKPQRTFLFAVLALLFLITGPSLALYAQGYRFDVQSKKLTQTGAFFFKARPARADIFVNGELVKTTDFLFRSALTGNFIPGPYRVTISKEGYVPWEKTLDIRENAVTEAKFVVLFPEHVNFRVLEGRVENVWFSPDKKKAVLEQESSRLLFWNIPDNERKVLWEPAASGDAVQSVKWSEGSERVLIQVSSRERVQTFVRHPLQDDTVCPGTQCSLDFLSGISQERIEFAAQEEQLVVLRPLGNSRLLQEIDYVEQEPLAFWGENVVTFAVSGGTLYWLEDSGTVWRANLASQAPPVALNSVPFPMRQETSYELLALGGEMFLKEDDAIFRFKEEGAERIADAIRTALLSPEGRKLALLSNSEISLYYLREDTEQPKRTAGERVFLNRFSRPISSATWLDGHHLAFTLDGELKITEIDTRDTLNTVNIAALENPELFWEPQESVFYVLDRNSLLVSERVIR